MTTRRLPLSLLLAGSILGVPALATAQPVEEGPVEEGPVEEGPVEEGPVEEGPVEEGGPVEDGPVEEPAFVPPALIRFVEATYPPRALEEGVQSSVVLQLDLGVDGRVTAAEVIDAGLEGYGFAEAALEAAKRFEFSPAKENGQPITVRINYKYNFVLKQEIKEVPITEGQGGGEGAGGEGEGAQAAGLMNLGGVALERGTRDPLVGVIVTVFKGEGEDVVGFEAVTDPEGRFAFYDLEPGEWKVLIEASGYYPFRTVEPLAAGEALDVVYFVEKGSYNPFDVLVEGERVRKEVNRRTITAQEIEKIPGTFGDPIKVVQNLPGVARVNALSGDVIVRGSAPGDTQLFTSAVGIPIVYHFGGLRSVVPLGMVDSIDFYPGNFSVFYGRAVGGILDVDIKDLRPERVHGYVDVNLYDSGAYVETPVTDELTVAVAARRSYIDTVLDVAIPDSAPISLVTAPVYYDYQLLVNWRPSRDHRLQLFVFGSSDRLEVVADNPSFDVNLRSNSASIETGFFRGILEYDWTPSEEFTSSTKIASGTNLLAFEAFGAAEFKLDVYQPSLRHTMSYTVSENTRVTGGLDAVWSKTDIRIKAPRPPKEGDTNTNNGFDDVIFLELKDIRTRDVAGFMELELKALDNLLFVPGVRVDYFETLDAVTFDPRLTARWELDPQWTIKGGAGLFHQAPGPDETAPEFGNPDLGPEAAFQYSLGVEYRPLEHLLIDVTGFYKDMFDRVARSNRVVERDGELVAEVYSNEGLGRVYGAEVLVRHEFANNFYGWIAYTLSRAERLDPGETSYRLFDFDQTHILTMLGTYRLPRNWEVGMRWRYVTGNPTTPNVGGIYNVDTGEYDPIPGAVNSARLPDFHQLDLRVDKKWIYDTWTFNAYMDIQNVYSRANSENIQYNFDFTQRRPGAGLPLLPIVGVKADF